MREKLRDVATRLLPELIAHPDALILSVHITQSRGTDIRFEFTVINAETNETDKIEILVEP